MISDQTIGSARAEEHWNRAGRRFIGKLLPATLAPFLVLASLTNLAAVEGVSQRTAESARDTLPLPGIQYLESMPWMNWKTSAPTLRIDTLMRPGGTPWGEPRNSKVVTEGITALS
jgi:hypothetical protein